MHSIWSAEQSSYGAAFVSTVITAVVCAVIQSHKDTIYATQRSSIDPTDNKSFDAAFVATI